MNKIEISVICKASTMTISCNVYADSSVLIQTDKAIGKRQADGTYCRIVNIWSGGQFYSVRTLSNMPRRTATDLLNNCAFAFEQLVGDAVPSAFDTLYQAGCR
jgi:hypothetical protein